MGRRFSFPGIYAVPRSQSIDSQRRFIISPRLAPVVSDSKTARNAVPGTRTYGMHSFNRRLTSALDKNRVRPRGSFRFFVVLTGECVSQCHLLTAALNTAPRAARYRLIVAGAALSHGFTPRQLCFRWRVGLCASAYLSIGHMSASRILPSADSQYSNWPGIGVLRASWIFPGRISAL